MRDNKFLVNYLHLHFIVLIWGFSGVLGKLISIGALPLVWYRMGLAALLLSVFVKFTKIGFKVSKKSVPKLVLAGTLLALHWITFFGAIKISNVSVVLVTMSAGAFFGAFLEPLWNKKQIAWFEVLLGLIAILGLYIILNIDTALLNGILLGLLSALLGTIFTIINAQLVQKEPSSKISFYEMVIGTLLVALILLGQQKFSASLFVVGTSDWLYIVLLASFCTAYAFTVSVKVMKYISAYTVLLTVNLEPVYGMVLALLVFGDSENMGPLFYLGSLIILATVVLNGILQKRLKKSTAGH